MPSLAKGTRTLGWQSTSQKTFHNTENIKRNNNTPAQNHKSIRKTRTDRLYSCPTGSSSVYPTYLQDDMGQASSAK
jgi:hypothetical protein